MSINVNKQGYLTETGRAFAGMTMRANAGVKCSIETQEVPSVESQLVAVCSSSIPCNYLVEGRDVCYCKILQDTHQI